MADKKRVLLKLNRSLRGYPTNIKVSIDVDKAGIPLDRYWRDRLKDSKIDNCVEIVKGSQDSK